MTRARGLLYSTGDRRQNDRPFYQSLVHNVMNLIEAIRAVPDHRKPRGIRHPLWLILKIILLGSCTES
ncbi:hypothetical protein QT972_33555 [Microcoleus sp. herbarium7]|uniref:hypothetical protein n=1 Tax=Microcoleus sp. herbarium13 TaxID=3055438 RepID=UPI002FD0B1C1